jgi:hypothetical protein
MLGRLCSRKPCCKGSTSYAAFCVRFPSHACLFNGSDREQTVHWAVSRRGNVVGTVDVMRQVIVNMDLRSSSNCSLI